MGRLNGKVAVITGASSGMGRATAIRFAGEGAKIVIADLNREGGESAARDCRENGSDAVFQKADVAAEADVKAAVDRAIKEYGRLDIIFNNAGLGGATGPLESTSVEHWDQTLAVLLRGVFLGMKYSIPQMRKAGGGSIISTASIAGIQGYAGIHAYSAAKAAVINLTRSAAAELGPDKIRVNCICPGGINTPLMHGGMPDGEKSGAEYLHGRQPMQREGRPDDIANMALFLASDDSEWITGTAMIVDGGFTAAGNFFSGVGSSTPTALPTAIGYAGPSFETMKK